jgi:hypothetical protein
VTGLTAQLVEERIIFLPDVCLIINDDDEGQQNCGFLPFKQFFAGHASPTTILKQRT